MSSTKLIYHISTKFNGNYKNVDKEFTRAEFEQYFDNCAAKGMKIVGYTNSTPRPKKE